jgi:dihydrofolate reductase
MTASLDGFSAGPDVSVERLMGEGGDRLHEWLFKGSSDRVDAQVARDRVGATGAGEKNVMLMGGAHIAQHLVMAGLVDEIRIQLVPVLLGAGTRLFDTLGTERVELERTRLIESPNVTHL